MPNADYEGADDGKEPSVMCTCRPEGCDEEGDPGCAYCRSLDSEWPCPAEEAESA
jgi:hypothetical protein